MTLPRKSPTSLCSENPESLGLTTAVTSPPTSHIAVVRVTRDERTVRLPPAPLEDSVLFRSSFRTGTRIIQRSTIHPPLSSRRYSIRPVADSDLGKIACVRLPAGG